MSILTVDLVPANVKGKASDLEFSETLSSFTEARKAFKKAMARLLDPNKWHDLAGWASAHFLLVGPDGEYPDRFVEQGDYLRIDIPGPGTRAGDGYDWVIVDTIEDYLDEGSDLEWIGMKVHPAPEPGKPATEPAHFFQDDASSTFIIQRFGNTLTVRYHGRNEVPNTSTSRPLDNIRNAVIAAGATISFSEAQWSALCKGFIR